MIDKGITLRHYKREDIQNEMILHSQNKEVVGSFGGTGYAKRPDTLTYPRDVLELVKQGITSFHASEERWSNPLQIDPLLKKQEIEKLRIGWDLVLDIDCPYWDISKIIAHLMVKTLKYHNIEAVSAKFSGNKGFHIGVPFEAFPNKIAGENVSKRFPVDIREIANYIVQFISRNYVEIKESSIVFNNRFEYSFIKLQEIFSKEYEEFCKAICTTCNSEIKEVTKRVSEYICPHCDEREKSEEKGHKICPKCSKLMERKTISKDLCNCGSNEFKYEFDPLSIVEVDTILISGRHLYRMPYSFHEKSGLVSIPIDPDKIIEFEKEQAHPEKIEINPKLRFLNRENVKPNQAKELFDRAIAERVERERNLEISKKEVKYLEDIPEEAIPEQFFPPCIQNIFLGLEDGRKRSIFILKNFLASVGWEYDKIEARLKEWNKKNKEPLREVLLIGQLRHYKQQQKKIMPPNCQNSMYYKDFAVCKPDNLCGMIKNPVQYAKRKTYYLNKEPNKKNNKNMNKDKDKDKK